MTAGRMADVLTAEQKDMVADLWDLVGHYTNADRDPKMVGQVLLTMLQTEPAIVATFLLDAAGTAIQVARDNTSDPQARQTYVQVVSCLLARTWVGGGEL